MSPAGDYSLKSETVNSDGHHFINCTNTLNMINRFIHNTIPNVVFRAKVKAEPVKREGPKVRTRLGPGPDHDHRQCEDQFIIKYDEVCFFSGIRPDSTTAAPLSWAHEQTSKYYIQQINIFNK